MGARDIWDVEARFESDDFSLEHKIMFLQLNLSLHSSVGRARGC